MRSPSPNLGRSLIVCFNDSPSKLEGVPFRAGAYDISILTLFIYLFTFESFLFMMFDCLLRSLSFGR